MKLWVNLWEIKIESFITTGLMEYEYVCLSTTVVDDVPFSSLSLSHSAGSFMIE